MLFIKYAILFISCSLLFLVSCSPKLKFGLTLTDKTVVKKVVFGKNKDAISFDMSYWRRGTFFIRHDFSFDQDLVVSLQEARVWYKDFGFPFNFIGPDLHKDTLHIDGDDNVLTVFSVPLNVKLGDTLFLKLDNFLTDIEGNKYEFQPIPLIVTQPSN